MASRQNPVTATLYKVVLHVKKIVFLYGSVDRRISRRISKLENKTYFCLGVLTDAYRDVYQFQCVVYAYQRISAHSGTYIKNKKLYAYRDVRISGAYQKNKKTQPTVAEQGSFCSIWLGSLAHIRRISQILVLRRLGGFWVSEVAFDFGAPSPPSAYQ